MNRFDDLSARGCLLLVIGFMGIAMTITGCAKSPESSSEELLEHAEIPHKPKSFAAGVESLTQRHAAWLKSPGVAAMPTAEESVAWSEMQDVVRWLPELAGDSDMPEQEWNQVRDLSRELLEEYEHLRLSPNPAILQSIVARLDQLRKLVPSTRSLADAGLPNESTAVAP